MTTTCGGGRVTVTTMAVMLLAAQLLLETAMAQQTDAHTAASESLVSSDICDREYLTASTAARAAAARACSAGAAVLGRMCILQPGCAVHSGCDQTSGLVCLQSATASRAQTASRGCAAPVTPVRARSAAGTPMRTSNAHPLCARCVVPRWQ